MKIVRNDIKLSWKGEKFKKRLGKVENFRREKAEEKKLKVYIEKIPKNQTCVKLLCKNEYKRTKP